MSPLTLDVTVETWPIAGSFRIARGAKTEAHVVVVALTQDGAVGRGECVPYARYGESIKSVTDQIEDCTNDLANGLERTALQTRLPPGAARNALDCAFWDLEAKLSGTPVWRLAGIGHPQPLTTAFTLSLASPGDMQKAAVKASLRPLLKLKLAGDNNDMARIAAVKQGAPKAHLIIDANEAWTVEQLKIHAQTCADLGVVLIEQPLPADQDEALADITSPVPLCADESVHDCTSFGKIAPLYDYINIKLDKTGGLTEALKLVALAKTKNIGLMVGCMVGTSLGMAPASLLGAYADFIDLDGPLLLAQDRVPGLTFEGSLVHPPEPKLWG